VAVERQGKKVPEKDLAAGEPERPKVVITDDKVNVKLFSPSARSSYGLGFGYRLDPTKHPKRGELFSRPGAEAIPGIYALNGGELRVCLWTDRRPGTAMPTEFAAKPGSGHTLYTLRRQPPPKVKLRTTLPMPGGRQTPGMAISPDGSKIATVHGTEARLWDAATGRELATLELASRTFAGGTVVFTPDGKTLAVV